MHPWSSPSSSRSYILKRKRTFSSTVLPANWCIVSMNSEMLMVPFLSESKMRKARSTKKGFFEGTIFLNSAMVNSSRPLPRWLRNTFSRCSMLSLLSVDACLTWGKI